MGVQLWHDDVRPAPEGWVWARTNDEAKRILSTSQVVEISLDHDLGFHDVEIPEDPDEFITVMNLKGRDSQTGLDLVHWMVENDLVPETVTIHSWNPPGAQAMAARLNRFGHSVTVRPFKP